jgi:hypothetical protein
MMKLGSMERRALLRHIREASSVLPGEMSGASVIELGPPHQGYLSNNTMPQPQGGSIYDINSAYLMGKIDTDNAPNRDEVAWEDLQPRYMVPKIPQHVRR